MKISFRLNGQDIILDAEPDKRVVDLLREDFQLTGTKEACGSGECGACTILVDGEGRLSCLMIAAQLEGRAVVTIEGLAKGETLHPVQEAFIERGAVQCGFCTPGMILSAVDLLNGNPAPTEAEIREGVSGNLCRCTGYQKIVDAIAAAAGQPGGSEAAKPGTAMIPSIPVAVTSTPRMSPGQRRTYMPESMDELWNILIDEGDAALFAGGTDFFVRERARTTPSAVLVGLDRIGELHRVYEENGALFIGGAATHRQILEHPLVGESFPVLARAIRLIGGPAVRTMGTLGGNICSASPAGDTLPPLYALSAYVEIRSMDSFRLLPLQNFLQGPGKTDLHEGEVLYGIWINMDHNYGIHHFEKVGQRGALAITVASMACVMDLSASKIIEKIHLAWGSVGPTVVTSRQVEDALVGRQLSEEHLREVMPLVALAVNPIDDVRASASYRRTVAANLLLRLLTCRT